MTQNWQILLPAILAGNFLFLPAKSIFHPHLAGKMALWHTMDRMLKEFILISIKVNLHIAKQKEGCLDPGTNIKSWNYTKTGSMVWL